ncbi:ABC transporter [Paenibacillus sp. GP183]|nr:ABC transporter [Paenibacillus sp. GP183]
MFRILDKVVTKIIELEDGEATVFHTHYSGYVKEKEELLLQQFANYEEQQKKIKQMKDTINSFKNGGKLEGTRNFSAGPHPCRRRLIAWKS